MRSLNSLNVTCNLNFSFESIRIEEKKHLCDCVPYLISYYLEDGTISVKERKQKNQGYDFCPFLIKRIKVPRYSKRLINSLIVAEDENVTEHQADHDYLRPNDFMVGKEVNLLGHRFLIRDCDARTRKYYEEILKVQQGDRVAVDKFRPMQLKHVKHFYYKILVFLFSKIFMSNSKMLLFYSLMPLDAN